VLQIDRHLPLIGQNLVAAENLPANITGYKCKSNDSKFVIGLLGNENELYNIKISQNHFCNK